jgi:type IX secretion system PorP/SprF family membrane protein
VIRVFLILSIVAGFLLIRQPASAQSDPVFANSNFNVQLANPAYAGTWAGTGYLMTIKKNWIGIENSPSTQVFTFQQQHFKQNTGWGLNILNDKTGYERRLALLGDYSYRIETNWRSYLYMGLRFGINSYMNNLQKYTTYDPLFEFDPAYRGVVNRYLIPNFGIGILLQSDNYQLSFSVPKIIQLEYDSDVSALNTYSDFRNYIFSGSMIFRLSYHVFLKPSLRLLLTRGAPLEINPAVDLLVHPRIWIGMFYRFNESAGITSQWIFDKNMRLGYAFEFPVTTLARHQFGTHEVMFSYELNFTRNNKYNFRFF